MKKINVISKIKKYYKKYGIQDNINVTCPFCYKKKSGGAAVICPCEFKRGMINGY